MKLIIDTDGGVDDAFALIFALESYDVLGITCVSGNIFVDRVCNNVGVVLDLCDKKVPFYKGAENFILSDWKQPEYLGHGLDGLGDTNMVSDKQPEDEKAVDALIRLTKEHDDVHIICIGPLTNVALACLIDDDFPNRVKSFTVMGGAHQCKGNTGLASEFNIHCDPEAAQICLDKFKMTRMITWETCYKCAFSWYWYNNLKGSKYIDFIKKINKKYFSLENKNNSRFIVPDLIAMLSYWAESEKSYEIDCKIELNGTHTRGATVFNWLDSENKNVRIVKMDMEKIYELVDNILYR